MGPIEAPVGGVAVTTVADDDPLTLQLQLRRSDEEVAVVRVEGGHRKSKLEVPTCELQAEM